MTNKTKKIVLISVACAAALAWPLSEAVQWITLNAEAVKYARYQNPAYDRNALASNPNDSLAYEGLANNEILHRNDDGALILYRKALILDPNNHEAAGELAADYNQLHRYDEAAQVLMVMARYSDSWGVSARIGLKNYDAYCLRRTAKLKQSGP